MSSAGWLKLHKMKDILHDMDTRSSPSLLPIFRSQQQAELLALVLGNATEEFALTQLAGQTGIPYPSLHREIERAQAAGLVVSRNVGRTRLVRANTDSPYFGGLADVLVKAFGVPWVLGRSLAVVDGVEHAYVYGSWAARFRGEPGDRPVGDIDLLVLGEPDRDTLYAAVSQAEKRLGRPIQVTVREPDWLENGGGSFHDTVASRALVQLDVRDAGTGQAGRRPARAQQP
jgi:predicted nucleotidyltransferase